MIDKLFDQYIWKARILVAVIVMTPVWVILPWLSKAIEFPGNPWFNNAIIIAALTAFGAMLVRHLGLQAEEKLRVEWGGLPTTVIMRWSNSQRSIQWKQRMRHLIVTQFGLTLLTPGDELKDPKEADRLITEAFGHVKSKIWGKKKLPSHTANIDYGFVRNLYGSADLWFKLAASCAAIAVIVPLIWGTNFPGIEFLLTAAMAIAIPPLAKCVIKAQVTHCAFRYAEHAWSYIERREGE